MILIEPHSCSTMGRAPVGLWMTIGVVFLASVVLVGALGWKTSPDIADFLVTIAAYGLAILASYVVIAFGSMVPFNC
ncbi:MAG: hypothetical protein U9R25_02030 [Chloroflexota bacterium]|nr:hypothetical protein [Chloroflexota bacterium]